MAAWITVNLNAKGEFEIWLNPEGRDVLVKELQGLSETNDHFHLGRHSRRFGDVRVISVLALIADLRRKAWHIRSRR
jgi:hypothetical protein